MTEHELRVEAVRLATSTVAVSNVKSTDIISQAQKVYEFLITNSPADEDIDKDVNGG